MKRVSSGSAPLSRRNVRRDAWPIRCDREVPVSDPAIAPEGTGAEQLGPSAQSGTAAALNGNGPADVSQDAVLRPLPVPAPERSPLRRWTSHGLLVDVAMLVLANALFLLDDGVGLRRRAPGGVRRGRRRPRGRLARVREATQARRARGPSVDVHVDGRRGDDDRGDRRPTVGRRAERIRGAAPLAAGHGPARGRPAVRQPRRRVAARQLPHRRDDDHRRRRPGRAG